MRKIFLLTVLVALSFACSDKKEVEAIKLTTFKDKLSYTLGADHARAISESGDPNFSKYDIDEIMKGFKLGLKDEKAFDEGCKNTMQALFGASGQEFNQKYAKDGSNCIGKISGIFFSNGWKQKGGFEKIDMDKVMIGFEQGLRKIDTLVPRTEQATLIQNFMSDLNKMSGVKMIEKAKKIPNVKITASGLVLETILEGKGGSPAPGDDVYAHYILINAKGDTLQNSYDMVTKYKQPLKPFSLNQVVAGWQEGIPMMKKGGKYHLYLPFHLAYGEQGMFNPQSNTYDIQPFESLYFFIELMNYGKPGTLSAK